MKWLVRGALAILAIYGSLAGAVAVAMVQPPERLGQFLAHVPAPIVWGVLPGQRLWMWARRGTLQEGDEAPDFTLPTLNHQERVTLSSLKGKPVVLVFGSYT